jgi:hypothetical protein
LLIVYILQIFANTKEVLAAKLPKPPKDEGGGAQPHDVASAHDAPDGAPPRMKEPLSAIGLSAIFSVALLITAQPETALCRE